MLGSAATVLRISGLGGRAMGENETCVSCPNLSSVSCENSVDSVLDMEARELRGFYSSLTIVPRYYSFATITSSTLHVPLHVGKGRGISEG